jgi:hypothetical protein
MQLNLKQYIKVTRFNPPQSDYIVDYTHIPENVKHTKIIN